LARKVHRGPLLVVEVGSKVASMVVMFVWAKLSPTVWALVVGSLTQSILEVVGSHLLTTGYRNRLRWDTSSARTIRSFGKWIFGSSLFTFLASEGDRILLGRFLTMGMLGVYSVAGMLSATVGQVVNRLVSTVFYGVFSHVARDRPNEVGRHYYSARLKLDLLAMPALGAVIVLGPDIVNTLYDSRYHEAGWMLQFLCVRVGLQSILYPCGVCLIALGMPRYQFLANAGRFVAVWSGIPIGWHIAGIHGVLWGTTASELPMLVVFWAAFRRLGLLRASRELLAPVAALGGAALGLVVKLLLHRYLPGWHLHAH
jgi:O-antigen/teichoic acid export membrane protein